MSIYNNNCRLKRYEDCRDWFLAWEVYKYLHRNENLLKQKKYSRLNEVAENIVVWHRLGEDSKSDYDDMKDFYQFFVTLAKDEVREGFELTDEVEKYLYFIKKEREDRIVRRIFSFVYGDEE